MKISQNQGNQSIQEATNKIHIEGPIVFEKLWADVVATTINDTQG